MKRLQFSSLASGLFGGLCVVLLCSAIYLNPRTTPVAEHDGVHNIDYPETQFLGVKATIPFSELENFYKKNFPAAFMAAGANGFTISGQPTGLFFVWDEENSKTEAMAAVPVTGTGKVPEGFELYTVESCKALQINYYGPYEGSVKAHEKMGSHMEQNKLEFMGPAMETYVTDPTTEPDQNKWLTVITYPLK